MSDGDDPLFDDGVPDCVDGTENSGAVSFRRWPPVPEGVSGPEQGAAVERLAKALEPFAAMGDNPNLLPNGNECDLRCGVPSPRQLREASAALAAYRAALRSAPPKETT